MGQLGIGRTRDRFGRERSSSALVFQPERVETADRRPMQDLRAAQGDKKVTRKDWGERARMAEHLDAHPAYKHEYGKDIRLPDESKKPTAKRAVTRGRAMSRKR